MPSPRKMSVARDFGSPTVASAFSSCSSPVSTPANLTENQKSDDLKERARKLLEQTKQKAAAEVAAHKKSPQLSPAAQTPTAQPHPAIQGTLSKVLFN